MIDLNVKGKTVTLIGDNLGEYLHDSALVEMDTLAPKAYAHTNTDFKWVGILLEPLPAL